VASVNDFKKFEIIKGRLASGESYDHEFLKLLCEIIFYLEEILAQKNCEEKQPIKKKPGRPKKA